MKNKIRFIIALGIIALIFSLCYFIIPFNYVNLSVYITSYIFMMVAILAQLYTFYVAFYKEKNLKIKVYGIPLVRVSLIYLVVTFIITILVTIFNNFFNVPLWFVLIVNVIIVGLEVMSIIKVEFYKDALKENEAEAKAKQEFMKTLRDDIKAFNNEFKYEPLREKFAKLYELIIYTDPISTSIVEDIEDEINDNYSSLKSAYYDNDYEKVSYQIDKVISLVKERSIKIRSAK